MKMFYTICYDIRDDGRRNQVAKILLDFGERVQFSVFEAILDADQLEALKRRVVKVLDPEEDSFRAYPLCANCTQRIEVIGLGVVTQDPEFIVI